MLVDYGFRLPSALDNRPLNFQEFQAMQGQTIYASATPSAQELEWSRQSAPFLVRVPASRSGPPEGGTLARTAEIGGVLPNAATAPGVVELIVRPTGLIDPKITLKPLGGQIDDLIEEARKRVEKRRSGCW